MGEKIENNTAEDLKQSLLEALKNFKNQTSDLVASINKITENTEGLIYDNMRPSFLPDPDPDIWVKKEEVQKAMAELIAEQKAKHEISAIEQINDPNKLTKHAVKGEIDKYGLTDLQRKWLLDYIFCVEGGYFNHPNDPGGETMYGIIEKEARQYGYKDAMKDLPKEVAVNIYLKKYWDNVGLKNIKNFGIALTIFDFQVNSGVRGAKIAQKTANRLFQHRAILPQFRELMDGTHLLTEDGKLGPKSFDVINKIPAFEFLTAYMIFQEDQYEDLMRNNPKLRDFDEGWENRCVKKSIFLGAMLREGVINL